MCDLNRDGYAEASVSVNPLLFQIKSAWPPNSGKTPGRENESGRRACEFHTGQNAALSPSLYLLFITGHVMGSLHTIALHYGPYKTGLYTLHSAHLLLSQLENILSSNLALFFYPAAGQLTPGQGGSSGHPGPAAFQRLH